MTTTNWSQQDVNAYIDGELTPEAQAQFEQALQENPALQQEVCELRKIKQKITAHYQKTPLPKKLPAYTPATYPKTAIAASAVLAFSLGMLFTANINHFYNTAEPSLQMAKEQQGQQGHPKQKLILHIDSNQPQKTQALINKASELLHAQHNLNADQRAQVDIVANHDGVEVFAADNANHQAIIELLSQYDNLKLIACQRALQRRAAKGQSLQLIEGVQDNQAAIDVIVDKMQQGWGYYKL